MNKGLFLVKTHSVRKPPQLRDVSRVNKNRVGDTILYPLFRIQLQEKKLGTQYHVPLICRHHKNLLFWVALISIHFAKFRPFVYFVFDAIINLYLVI